MATPDEYGVGPVYGPHTGPENWARWHRQMPPYAPVAAPETTAPPIQSAPTRPPTTLAPPGTGA